MKKRIITAALAAVLALNILAVRPKAVAGAVAAATAIGTGAVFLMGLITGQYDDTADGIGAVLENGWEGFEKAFIGTEKTFCGQVIESNDAWIVSGYKAICSRITSWFESDEVVITADGKIELTYAQYLELYNEVAKYNTGSFDLASTKDYGFLDTGFGFRILQSVCHKLSSYYTYSGMSYVPIYYSESDIFFSSEYFWMKYEIASNGNHIFETKIQRHGYVHRIFNFTTATPDSVLSDCEVSFCYTGNTLFLHYKLNMYGVQEYNIQPSYWWKYDGIEFTQVSSPDLTSGTYKPAYLICEGEFESFKDSIQKYQAVPADGLDDLSTVLPLDKTKNPGLVVDTDPSIALPTDAVTVTDIPGEADVTISQLKANTRLDLDIPSMIATKFPFCIPFDLVRIMSVLGADPVAPVFRIPISTDPKNLEAFKGNQTIGEVPEDFEPMFEINEEIVLDLSCIPLVQPVCYTVFIIGFIVLLIYITPKMINH